MDTENTPTPEESGDKLSVWTMGAGLILALSIQARGGKYYTRRIVDEHTEVDDETGEVKYERRRTETTAVTTSPVERKKAEAICTWARRAAQTVCARTVIGLVAPQKKRDELAAILAEIRAAVQAFNDFSSGCEIVLSTPVYEIAPADAETVAALSAQLEDITAQIQKALEDDDKAVLKAGGARARGGKSVADVLNMPRDQEYASIVAHCRAAVMRKLIAQVKGMDDLLEGEASQQVKDLVTATRAVAADLRKRVDKDEQTLKDALAAVDTSGISLARAAFVAAHRKARASADADLADKASGIESPVKRAVRAKAEPEPAEGPAEGSTVDDQSTPEPEPEVAPAVKPRAVARRGRKKTSGDDDDGGSGGGAKVAPPPRRVARRGGGWRRRGQRHTVKDEDSSKTGESA